MKIGISTACFYPNPLELAFARIAALDLDLCEIFFNCDSEMESPFVQLMQNELQQHTLTVRSVHPYTSLMEGVLLFSDYPRRTQDGLARYRSYLKSAHQLGAKCLTLHGERHMNSPISPQLLPYKIQAYRALCDIAKEYDMVIAQENVAWCKSSSPEFLRALRQAVPDLRFTFDLKQAVRAQVPWQDYLAVMNDRLVNIHINDYDDTHTCLLPGEGNMDYHTLKQVLDQIGYTGDALIEVYGSNFQQDAQIAQAVHHLRQIFS